MKELMDLVLVLISLMGIVAVPIGIAGAVAWMIEEWFGDGD
jgi:hypothetical protein